MTGLDSTADAARARRSPIARRQRALSVFAVFAVLASAAGLIISTRVKSPAELAADTKPPIPSVLTATVTRKVLATTLVMRGTFAGGRRFHFTPSSVAPTSQGPGGSTLIVTDISKRVGTTVKPGDVVIEVSERPVYVLQGRFPAYRDMVPGETGKDIAQLQSALSRLGCRSWDRDGFFGSGTKFAVRCFYRRLGYASPLASTASTADPIVPMSEVAFLPQLPARIVAQGARLGEEVVQPLVSFTSSGLTLTAKLQPEDAALVRPGMKVDIASESTGFAARGTIASVGQKVMSTSEPPYVPLRISRERPWPPSLEGEDVRVTVTTASSGQAVLAVPEAAIASSADGRTTITLISGTVQRVVDVDVGVSAGGWVEITSTDAQVTPGAEVVTGK